MIDFILLFFPLLALFNSFGLFSRLIIGSDQGDLRFFDVQYLRQDSYNELIYNGKEKIKKTDQISTIFAFQDLPIILAGHDSGINRFIIIPPNNFKYHIIKRSKFLNSLSS